MGSAPVGLLSLLGVCGVSYSILVARRLRVQTLYDPVLEDWLFHAAAHGGLRHAGGISIPGRTHVHEAMFGVAPAALLLLFIGIHNAWDAVTYHVL